MDSNVVELSKGFNNIPDELLLKIIGYLPLKERIITERVCKTWQSLAFYRFNSFVFSWKAFRGIRWDDVYNVLSKFDTIESVTIEGCRMALTDGMLSKISEKLKTVERIRFSDVNINDQQLKLILAEANQLKSLSLVYTQVEGIGLASTIVEKKSGNGFRILKLKSVCFWGGRSRTQRLAASFMAFTYTAETLERVLLRRVELREIDFQLLSYLKHLKHLRFAVPSNMKLFNTYLHFEQLEILELDVRSKYSFDDNCLRTILERHGKLKGLSLRPFYGEEIPRITNSVIESLPLLCPDFRILKVEGTPYISDACFDSLVNLPKLGFISLFNCEYVTKEGLASFIMRSQSLRGLNIPKMNDKVMEAFIEKTTSNPKVEYFVFLEKLNKSNVNIPLNVILLTTAFRDMNWLDYIDSYDATDNDGQERRFFKMIYK